MPSLADSDDDGATSDGMPSLCDSSSAGGYDRGLEIEYDLADDDSEAAEFDISSL